MQTRVQPGKNNYRVTRINLRYLVSIVYQPGVSLQQLSLRCLANVVCQKVIAKLEAWTLTAPARISCACSC